MEPENLATCTDEEFEKWLREQAEGMTPKAPSLSEIEGDEVDPWDY
ncbi:MAG: hypothetical protein HRU18_27505 [Pseudoalteromonas sp.]|nr:hypothetical protein [Pseudoalteromonas sp.]NRA81960.1 hypothetical protein [Pseudoalteromonas sp.]